MLLLNINKLKTHAYLKNLLDKDTTFLNTKYTRLQSKDGNVYVTINTTIFQLGTALNNAIIENDEIFDIGVSGTQFFTAIGALNGETAKFKVKDNILLISDDTTRIKLPIITGIEIDSFDAQGMHESLTYGTFTVGDLAKLTSFTTSDNTAFSGVTLNIKGDVLSFYATNRHHIGFIDRSGKIIDHGQNISVILPKETISALAKLGTSTEITISRNSDTNAIYFNYAIDQDTYGHIVTRILNFEPANLDKVINRLSAEDIKDFQIDRVATKDTVVLLKTLTQDTTISFIIKKIDGEKALVVNHPDFSKRLPIGGDDFDGEIEIGVDVDGILNGLSTFDDTYIRLLTSNDVQLIGLQGVNNMTIHAKKRRF